MPNYKNRQGDGTVETDILIVGDAEIKQLDAQADSVATDADGIVEDFNDLLAKLRDAGIMKE